MGSAEGGGGGEGGLGVAMSTEAARKGRLFRNRCSRSTQLGQELKAGTVVARSRSRSRRRKLMGDRRSEETSKVTYACVTRGLL